MAQALAAIDAWIQSRESHYMCGTPAHSIMECYRHPELRPIFNHSGLTTPDGMSIVWLLRLSGFRHVSRVYGPDLMRAACAHSIEKGYRHFFYGGTPEVLADLVRNLRATYLGLQVAGSYSPPFRPLTAEEETSLQEMIHAARPDILWVGIGSPKQERWMSEHVDRLGVPVLIGVGAAFDFLSGHKKQAPKWMQRSGLEWLYRLVSEPRRLWRRYALMPLFIWMVVRQRLGIDRY
jgi:N-acetylglucosaminyldiphosphoundecaprenol N-acetyl-beta-D-mannosaminyltransferase